MFLPPGYVLKLTHLFSQPDGKKLLDIPVLGGEALCAFPVADNRLSLRLYWAADDQRFRRNNYKEKIIVFYFTFSNQSCFLIQKPLASSRKPQTVTHTNIYLRDQLKGVVYQMSSVFVAQSSVVFTQQFSHHIPATILIMNHVIARHIRVYLNPAGFLSYMYTIWIKHIQ